MHKFARHIQHYTPLFAIFATGLCGIFLFSYDQSFQIAIMIATAMGYISWGIVHHYLHGDLQAYVVAEYASIAIIGIVIVFSLLYV